MKYPRMTEDEYVEWCDPHTFAEWVNGKVIDVSRIDLTHARLSSFLLHLVGSFVEEHDLGTVLRMPYQIRLASRKCRRMADLMFVSRTREVILTEYHAEGPPDLICEVLTRESQTRDRRDKFVDYQDAGVMEYWMVDPRSQTFEMYRPHTFIRGYELVPMQGGVIYSVVLPQFYIKPAWLWRAKFPKVSDLFREIASKR